MVEDSADSLMAAIGGVIAIRCLRPLGFGEWQPVAASISGFTAKEAIVSTMGVLANVAGDTEDAVNRCRSSSCYPDMVPDRNRSFTFLMFNLLDSPCLAAIATMAKEMKARKWFWFAILYPEHLCLRCLPLLLSDWFLCNWWSIRFRNCSRIRSTYCNAVPTVQTGPVQRSESLF